MRAIAILPLLLALGGCAVFSAPEPPDYVQLRIDGTAAEIPTALATAETLLVSLPRAAPGYATTHFAYLQRDRELRYYGRHEWISEPARMLQTAVVSALDRSGRFAAIVSPQSGANADLRLDLELVTLHQDFRSQRGSEIVLVVRALLVETTERRVIASRTFDIREPAAGNPIAGAAAADRALARFLEELTVFCVDAS